jgi:hypothetical protein
MRSSLKKLVATAFSFVAVSLTLMGGAQAAPATAQAPANTAGPAAINSTEDLIQWMTYYYLHPQPDLLVPALKYADANGLVDKGQAPLTAFVSRVFAQNPQRINEWMGQLDGLSSTSKPMLWSALWWSNSLEGKKALDALLQTLNEKQASMVIAQMAKPAQPIEKMEINSPEVLDELWGAFSATGDEKYVQRLISVLPWATATDNDYNKLTIGAAARWSLTSNAQQHPLVLQVCMKAREQQPALRPMLDKVINDATKGGAKQTGSSGATSGNSGKAL